MLEIKVIDQFLQWGMQAYFWKLLEGWDEATSVISFWTEEKGNLTYFSYNLHMPAPLGKEFKKVTCSVTGALISIEFQQ